MASTILGKLNYDKLTNQVDQNSKTDMTKHFIETHNYLITKLNATYFQHISMHAYMY